MNCCICEKSVGNMELQQPLKINGKVLSAHFYCGTMYLYEEVEVYKITYDGTSYYDTELPIDMFTDSDIGTEYTISKQKINKNSYYNMKEFEGF